MDQIGTRTVRATALGVVLAAALCAPALASAATPVQLYSARIDFVYNDVGGILVGYDVSGYVAIRPSTLAQSVSVHYTYDGVTWSDAPATYLRTAPDGYRVYAFKTAQNDPDFHYYDFWAQLAVKYVEGTTTYWDSNGGANYYARSTNVPVESDHPFILARSALTQETAGRCYQGTGAAGGQVILKNLAYAKTVRVVYTTDGWKTQASVDGSYLNGFTNDAGVTDQERWGFQIPSIPCGSTATVEYAIAYTVNGVTYWDNAFGANYRLP